MADFQRIADEAVEQVFDPEAQQRAVRRFNPAAYYVLNGTGLWRGVADADGVDFTRLFTGEKARRTWGQWTRECAAGRIRQV